MIRALVKGLRQAIDQGNVDPHDDAAVNTFVNQFMGVLGATRRDDSLVDERLFARVAVAAAMALTPLEGGDYGLPNAG